MFSASRVALLVLMVFVPACAIADSPVTSTPFSDAYLDYAAVKAARDSGVMTPQIAQYLGSSAPVDVKAAVVNALSWAFEGKRNAALYCQMRYRKQWQELNTAALAGDELMVLGYLLAMDDYNDVDRALPFLDLAWDKLPQSYTVAMVRAVVRGQAAFGEEGPGPWQHVERVLNDPTLNGDMRIGASKIIVEYMALYKPEAED